MVKLELTQDEVKTLATLIDAAVRHSGIQAVKPAHQMIVKMDEAIAVAQAQAQSQPEQKDEANNV